MGKVTIQDKKVWVDTVGIPLVGGEIHYWRLAPEHWKEVLRRAKEMGIEVISTYVCWDFHEYERGFFDFQGKTNPRRNLIGFLDMLTQEGFWIIIRPGPYTYAEWSNSGVPDYAAIYHRLDPEYLQMARTYMQAVVPVLQPYFATNGGRIILFQADNEVDSWHQWYTEKLGLGVRAGLFQNFLQERYLDIEKLNRNWGTNFSSFNQARAVLALPPGQKDYMSRFLDFCRFKQWYVLRASEWIVHTYRKLGVDIPIYMNSYQTVSVQPWSEMEKLVDFVGPDLYPSNEFNHHKDEHLKFIDSIRYTRTYSRLPYICEFQSGIWHGWHYDVGILTPNHYRMICLSALLAGVAGWSWYMLANRDNWYMCPINEKGKIRPEIFQVFSKIVEIFREADPTVARKLVDTCVTFDPLQRQVLSDPNNELLNALYRADIDYEYYDVNTGTLNKPLLFYAGDEWLSEAGQNCLLQYVITGGHLVIIGTYPRLNEQMMNLNMLEIEKPAGVIGEIPEGIMLDLDLNGVHTVIKSPYMAYYDSVSGMSINATRQRGERSTQEEMDLIQNLPCGDHYTVGYTQCRGKGKITVLGLAPTTDLVNALHAYAGITIASQSLVPDIFTALFEREGRFYLVIVNSGNETKSAQIYLSQRHLPDKNYLVNDLVTGKSWQVYSDEIKRLGVVIPRKDATILRLSPVN